MRLIGGPNPVRGLARECALKHLVREAQGCFGAVEIRKPKNQGSKTALPVRAEREVLLLFAIAAFSCVRVARMRFRNACGLRSAVSVHAGGKRQARNASLLHGLKCLAHQYRMLTMHGIWKADGINH